MYRFIGVANFYTSLIGVRNNINYSFNYFTIKWLFTTILTGIFAFSMIH